MPYSVGGSNLPSNVKKMDKKAQGQWVSIFNGALKDGKSESDAFKLANGVAKKDYYDDLYEASYKKLAQDDAGYDAVGMKDGMACASCHWFISPESCALVQGDISPTGLSKFYMKAVPQTPYTMPVTIVEPNDGDADDAYTMPLMGKSQEGNIVAAVLNGVKSLLGFHTVVKSDDVLEESGERGALQFYSCKDATGDTRLRFIAVVSNNFKDRESEIITEAAHREYVSWATKESSYPELWLWHAGPLSRWGQADWLDVSDGFLVASGLVDKGFEYIAHNLEAQAKAGNPNGVSHGFLCAKSGTQINRYRSFELSPLPITAAANEWTGFNIFAGEEMAFTPEKREWLRKMGGISDETLTVIETATSNVAKELKQRGIEYKDLAADATAVADTVEVKAAATAPAVKLSPLDAAIRDIIGTKEADPKPAPTTAPSGAPVEGTPKPVTPPHTPVQQPQPGGGAPQTPNPQSPDPQTKAEGAADTLSSKEFTALSERIAATNESVASIGTQVKELTDLFKTAIVNLSKSDDTKVADFFKARADGLPKGFQASESDTNTSTPLGEMLTKEVQASQKKEWFTDVVMKGLEIA